MMYGNFYGYQPNAYGAMPDTLNQFKTPYQTAAPQNNSGLVWVQGEAGAKSYLVPPGQSALLMDSESLRFYLKTADASGMPMPLRVFEYSEITGQAQTPNTASAPPPNLENFITREEFESRLAQIAKPAKKAKEDVENV